MKKRLLAVLCASAIILSLSAAGCANNEKKDSSEGTKTSTSSQTGKSDESSAASGEKEVTDAASTQKTIIFNAGGQKIYNSGAALYAIKDNNTFEFVETAVEEESGKTYEGMLPSYVFASPQQVITGTDAYFFDKDSGTFAHLDLSDTKNAKKETVYTAEKALPVIKAAIQKNTELDDEQIQNVAYCLFSTVSSPIVDGGDGFVYGTFTPGPEYYEISKPIAYQIYRIAKDGSKFEFIEDDSYSASSIAIKDGYIYYYDGGFAYDKEKHDATTDMSRVGIFKMKTDGSEKKELVKTALTSESDGNPVEAMKCSGRLDIVGDELYYILSQGQLYKVGLEGGNSTQVTKKDCNNYYIDAASGMLYYSQGKLQKNEPNGYPVVAAPLAGGDEKALFITTNTSSVPGMWTVDGDYLYLSNIDGYSALLLKDKNHESEFSPSACGRRWNLKEGYMEILYAQVEVEYEEGAFGVKSVKRVGAPTIKWEKE